MGPVIWAVLTGIGVASIFGYRKLHAMERELRREVAEEKGGAEEKEGVEEYEVAPGVEGAPLAEAQSGATELEDRLLQRVREQPGLLQTELYGFCPEENRRTVQELLRKLDREGRLARTKEKGSYRLYPVQ